jgi:predicted Kef-type K+ transport protein
VRRKLFNVLSAVSLLLLLIVVVTGVLSFWASEDFAYTRRTALDARIPFSTTALRPHRIGAKS